MAERTMQFGNFNITFGENNEPMLEHFEDIIYPAMTSGLKRGDKQNNNMSFLFNNVELKRSSSGEYIFTGNVIKDFDYEINSRLVGGELQNVHEIHPDAPYSRFIIFLKNHRMLIVKNGKYSPDIRSFGATLRDIVRQYRSKENKKRKKLGQPFLPYAVINIVGIPMENSITKALERVVSIHYLDLVMHPLNGDIDYNPLVRGILEMGKDADSPRQTLQVASPKSKKEVARIVDNTAGIVQPKLHVTYSDGSKGYIKEDILTENIRVQSLGDLKDGEEDEKLIDIAKNYPVVTKTTKENGKIYESKKNIFVRIIEKIKSRH